MSCSELVLRSSGAQHSRAKSSRAVGMNEHPLITKLPYDARASPCILANPHSNTKEPGRSSYDNDTR